MSLRMKSVIVVAFGASACYVSTNATLIDRSVRLARLCPDAVKLYTSPDRIQGSYREVAILNSLGETETSNERELIESMRKKAASVGANGIILGSIDEPNAITKVAGAVAKVTLDRRGHAMAIFVPADSIRSVTACQRK